MMLAKKIERRKHTRSSVRWPITVVSDHGNILGETRNISFDGVYIRCDQPLRINENFRMAITPPDKEAIGLTGKVVWSDFYGMEDDDTAVGMGVCLVEISARDRKSFQDAVSGHIRH
jgi:hypothetical protein